MAEVSVNIHPNDGRLHLEVITDEGGGNVTARSIEFDVVDPDRAAVEPHEPLPKAHEEEIRTGLADAGYAIFERSPA